MNRIGFILILLSTFFIVKAGPQVTFNGKTAAVDTLTGTWLLSVPESVFGTDYEAIVAIDDSLALCTIEDSVVIDHYTFSNVQPGATYHLCMVCGSDTVAGNDSIRANDTIRANIQFTFWPVIQIYGDFVKRPYYSGTVVYTHPDSAMQETLISRVRWAGSSTAAETRNKHNFHLKFYNEDSTKREMSFFGLRSDFHWRLDAGQVDFARVRNRVAKDIWAEYAHKPYYAAYEPKTPYNYVRGDFVEVFLNDQYMGIYSLNEHMDRQQLKLKKYDYDNGEFHGGLWKPMQMTSVTLFRSVQTSVDPTQKSWDEFYVKYPNIDDVNPTNFGTMYNAVKFTMVSSNKRFADSVEYYFDIPVIRDFYLFLILFQAPDNLGKNHYFACYDVATDKRLTMAIWDTDCSQGQYWSNEGSDYHNFLVDPEFDFKNEKIKEHYLFRRLSTSDSTFHGYATERYLELRGTTFNVDSIMARYEAYFNEMKACGADQREIARWSYGSDLGGRELHFDNELEYLRDWWTRHLAYLDQNVFIPYPMGDVNFDRIIDINDITILIEHVLTGNRDRMNLARADLNGDGLIDIDDICDVIAIVLDNEAQVGD